MAATPRAKTLLVDDRLLLDHLLGSGSTALKAACRRRSVYTTGLWYYRLCHAVGSDIVTGALSGPFRATEPAIRARAAASLIHLPDDVGLLGLRVLAPTMAALVKRHRLNAMSLEALAAANQLDAEIALAIGGENPLLMQAAEAEGIVVHVIGT